MRQNTTRQNHYKTRLDGTLRQNTTQQNHYNTLRRYIATRNMTLRLYLTFLNRTTRDSTLRQDSMQRNGAVQYLATRLDETNLYFTGATTIPCDITVQRHTQHDNTLRQDATYLCSTLLNATTPCDKTSRIKMRPYITLRHDRT